jgi:hypothetical protein
MPIRGALQATVLGRGARELVIGKHDAMSDKGFVFNRDALTDKGVRRDLASRTDPGSGLNFHKGSDAGFIANLTAIKVDEIRVKDTNIPTETHVTSDRHKAISFDGSAYRRKST